ncbi:UDP-glycosyltransferase UGT5-like isoform X36 [Planococcus citri]|uniref:UDP-glycosyltransferase UGT5-like isoform X36 n=1 Tax=Planococcus citri TaxID=170843 RepID=UPI0031F87E48
MLFLILISVLCPAVYSYNILGLFTSPMKSHHIVYDSLMTELARRGHNVTIYSAVSRSRKHSIPLYHEIDISACFGKPSEMSNFTRLQSSVYRDFRTISLIFTVLPSYNQIKNCGPLMELKNTSMKYDVLIAEFFNTDFFFLFGYHLGIPSIAFHSNALNGYQSDALGLPYTPSYIPNILSGYTSKMNFSQRLNNAWYFWYSLYAFTRDSRGKYDAISKEIFGPGTPPLREVAKNISLMFSYVHFSLNYVRPMVPNVVEIGGLNIEPSEPLPQNIEKFINESKHGVVYFCMGSLLRGETFPPEKREAFLYAFSKIPQRVLWKWEGDVLPGKSDNIMISKWMPQRDILAHPNVKLFISHGGLLGTSEAVYEGVPVLGIPIFGDQRTNIKSLEANGAGELLDYNEISKEVVLEKIQRLLNDPKYKENAKLLSDRYRDRPMSPLDTAVYWTEYVIRHKGAPHLRTAAADMPWYQYLLLDVIAFIVAVLVAGLLIIYYTTKFILRAIYGLICGGGAKKGSSKSDKKKRN